ncbi:MAG: hypothetical protein MJZ05_09340 [Fibrobacter sp.]|nr:hypothetical protein [Fibrobacter sp.]
MIKKLLTSALLVGSFASSAFAGEHWNVDLGGVSMKFLSMPVSARSAALSGAGVADPARVSEASRNPLAMSTVKNAEFGVSQLIFGEHRADNFISAYYGIPFTISNYKVAASATIDFVGYDNIEGRDEYGNLTTEYGAFAWSIQAGLGSQGEVFNWGANIRLAQQTIDDESAIAFLGDIAGSFKVNQYFAFAATLTNFGFMGDYDGVDEAEPMALQAGISGFFPIAEKWNAHVSADAYRRADTDAYWLFGGEVNYLKTLSFRMGYAIRPNTKNAISCGLGIAFSMIVFDYGYSPKPALQAGDHYITLGLKF